MEGHARCSALRMSGLRRTASTHFRCAIGRSPPATVQPARDCCGSAKFGSRRTSHGRHGLRQAASLSVRGPIQNCMRAFIVLGSRLMLHSDRERSYTMAPLRQRRPSVCKCCLRPIRIGTSPHAGTLERAFLSLLGALDAVEAGVGLCVVRFSSSGFSRPPRLVRAFLFAAPHVTHRHNGVGDRGL